MRGESWGSLVIIGLFVGLLLGSFFRRGWALWLRFLLGGLALIGFYVVTVALTGVALGDRAWYDTTPWRELILVFFMILGMWCFVLREAIGRRRVRRDKERETQAGTKGRNDLGIEFLDLVYPLLVAVPVVGMILSQVQNQEMSWLVVAIAFESGFFSHAMVKGPK